MYFPVEVSKIFSGNGVAKGEADRKPVKGSAAAITKTVPTQENQRQSETAINTYGYRSLPWIALGFHVRSNPEEEQVSTESEKKEEFLNVTFSSSVACQVWDNVFGPELLLA